MRQERMRVPAGKTRSVAGQRGTAAAAAVLLALAAAACDEEPREVVMARRAAGLTQSSLELTYVSGAFAVDPSLAGFPVDMAGPQVVDQVRRGFGSVVSRAECLLVRSDQATFIELSFDHCGQGIVGLDGSVRAEMTYETAPCPGGQSGQCPIAVVYTVKAQALVIGAAAFSGSWMVRAPTRLGEPMRASGMWSLESDARGRFSTTSQMVWRREGPCVSVLSLDGELLFENPNREVRRGFAVSAEGVVGCLHECPRSGRVFVAFGRGEILSFSYTGSDEVIAYGPRGRQFPFSLPCAPAGPGRWPPLARAADGGVPGSFPRGRYDGGTGGGSGSWQTGGP